MNSKWQWIDNNFGPMGWFSDEEKKKHEGTAEFMDGHWRELSPEEVAQFQKDINKLAYEQS